MPVRRLKLRSGTLRPSLRDAVPARARARARERRRRARIWMSWLAGVGGGPSWQIRAAWTQRPHGPAAAAFTRLIERASNVQPVPVFGWGRQLARVCSPRYTGRSCKEDVLLRVMTSIESGARVHFHALSKPQVAKWHTTTFKLKLRDAVPARERERRRRARISESWLASVGGSPSLLWNNIQKDL